MDHSFVLHKLRAVGITGNIDLWLFHFLTDRSIFFYNCLGELVKTNHPVIYHLKPFLVSLMFLIMISDIDKDAYDWPSFNNTFFN